MLQRHREQMSHTGQWTYLTRDKNQTCCFLWNTSCYVLYLCLAGLTFTWMHLLPVFPNTDVPIRCLWCRSAAFSPAVWPQLHVVDVLFWPLQWYIVCTPTAPISRIWYPWCSLTTRATVHKSVHLSRCFSCEVKLLLLLCQSVVTLFVRRISQITSN